MTAKLPPPKEHEVQAEIKQVLELCGLHVLHTTAYRQKGPSGVCKGVPDLLISHDELPWTYLGIEVKRPGKSVMFSSAEQKAMAEAQRFAVCQSVESAALAAVRWLQMMGVSEKALAKATNVLRGIQGAG